MDFLKNSKSALEKAAKIINNGGVIAFSTDTVYGFLADATNKKAVEKIYRLKKRPRSKPLPVFVKDIKMAGELAEISIRQEKILKKYWPGPYTFLLRAAVIPAKAGIQSKKTNSRFRIKPGMRSLIVKNDKIALRIPKHKFLNDLLKKINKPLAQTSVNISGEPVITKIKEIKKTFCSNPNLDLIVDDGNLEKSKPSAIIDLTGKHLTRLR